MAQCVTVDLHHPDVTDFRQNVVLDLTAGDVDAVTLTPVLKVMTYSLVTLWPCLSIKLVA